MSSLQMLKEAKKVNGRGERTGSKFFILVLEREPLLSSFPTNPTVGNLRDKKESCSTRSGLRVDTGCEEF